MDDFEEQRQDNIPHKKEYNRSEAARIAHTGKRLPEETKKKIGEARRKRAEARRRKFAEEKGES